MDGPKTRKKRLIHWVLLTKYYLIQKTNILSSQDNVRCFLMGWGHGNGFVQLASVHTCKNRKSTIFRTWKFSKFFNICSYKKRWHAPSASDFSLCAHTQICCSKFVICICFDKKIMNNAKWCVNRNRFQSDFTISYLFVMIVSIFNEWIN